MQLLEQPIHDETVKTNYYTWWQNVRESYQARSLRLTKQGFEMLESTGSEDIHHQVPPEDHIHTPDIPLVG